MSELSDVTHVFVPLSIITDGYAFMRSAGRMRLEGLVLWAGHQDDAFFKVTELIVPQQRGLDTPDGLCAIVDAPELRRLNLYLYEKEIELIAQFHTHPRHAYHSETDDRNAIANTIGCFSIVAPNFAVIDYPLSQCAVFRLDEKGQWLEVDESAAPNQITVVKD